MKTGEKRDSEEFEIEKWGRFKSWRKARRLQYRGRFPCRKYGLCMENNYCFHLKNIRGGDFGWAECIYKEGVKK